MKKELKELTVREVIAMPRYRDYVDEVIKGEVFNHRQAEVQAITQGRRLQRTAYDSLHERGVLEVDKIVELFVAVMDKSLIGFSAAEREYIYLIGYQAFYRLMVRLQEEEKEKRT